MKMTGPPTMTVLECNRCGWPNNCDDRRLLEGRTDHDPQCPGKMIPVQRIGVPSHQANKE